MQSFNLDDAIRPMGESLLEFSKHAQTSVRGLVTAFFPYILPASRRMSTRAISAFLKEEHHVNISAASIAKALREPQKHVAYLADSIEPDARIVADALELDLGELLAREDLFRATAEKPPILGGESEHDLHDAHDAYLDARHHLEQSWYPLDASVRGLVIADIEAREDEVQEFSEAKADE